MKQEKSCGAVVYKTVNGELYFLVILSVLGHYGFPKGHVELNETEKETTIREVKEETGIDIEITSSFNATIRYIFKFKELEIDKEVNYFIATPLNDVLKKQDTEVDGVYWIKESEVLNVLTYNNSKEVFLKALNEIKNKRQ